MPLLTLPQQSCGWDAPATKKRSWRFGINAYWPLVGTQYLSLG
jgi:hypothetical protein